MNNVTMAKNLSQQELDAKGVKLLIRAFLILFGIIGICSICFGFIPN
ncbi:MAG: hypothetical protein RL641_555 [Candidatus Parcubacteria bacterium]|jgi:hypothetical protein